MTPPSARIWELVRQEVATLNEALISTRRDVHARPELAFEETATAALISGRLRSLGLEVRTGVGGTGVLADIASGRAGRTVLVRADMDALPIEEVEDGRPYRSTAPGVSHACGHDGHVAIALSVAEILVRLRDHWSGTVRMCFQPAEETDAGAEAMLSAGAAASADHAVGLHLMTDMATGIVGVGSGIQWASSDELRLTVNGGGGHAGNPGVCTNPVTIASDLIRELARLSADDQHPGLVTIAMVQSGTAHNVVPREASLSGTVRAFDPAERATLMSEIERVCARTVTDSGATLTLSWGAHCPALDCDENVTSTISNAFTTASTGWRVTDTSPVTGADDMARFLQAVPGSYFRVGAGGSRPETAPPHHHPSFDLDEAALSIAAEALTLATLAILGSP